MGNLTKESQKVTDVWRAHRPRVTVAIYENPDGSFTHEEALTGEFWYDYNSCKRDAITKLDIKLIKHNTKQRNLK